MLNRISHWLYPLTRSMHFIAGIILVSMMFVTLADIATRSLFEMTSGSIDLTFIGGVELIKYGLLITVFFCLPHSVERSQVMVDLFTNQLSERKKAALHGFFITGYVFLGLAMSYQFYLSAEDALMTHETTQDLQISVAYFYWIISAASAVLAVAALVSSLRLMFGQVEVKS
ncbi:TRAP transporter small permease [Thalassolituus sp. LLYu03]|uniref:TRAP transporter small permease n=1 Tax=Thalassolituus sp. LLYu03 TaxID=3421656 RepID=UPI003D272950